MDPIEAENGLQALEILAESPVDVVLLDLLMPELTATGRSSACARTNPFGTSR